MPVRKSPKPAPSEKAHAQGSPADEFRADPAPPAEGVGFVEASEVRWLDAASEVNTAVMMGGPDSALDAVAWGALRAARGTLAAVVLPAREGMLEVLAAAGEDSAGLIDRAIAEHEAALWWEACATGLPLVVGDVATDPRASGSTLFRELGLGPLMVVTLVAVEGQLGALTVGRHAGSAPFTPVEVAALGRYARHVALVSRFGRLHASEQHQRAWWEATAQVTNALLTADPVEAMETVVATAAGAAGAQRAVLAVADSDGAPIVVEAVDGAGAEDLRGTTVPYDSEPLFAETLAARQVMTVDDPGPGEPARHSAPLGRPEGPLLVAPVFMDRPRAGCLSLCRPEGAPAFTPLDVKMAGRFAAHAALTLRFTRLFQEVRRGRELRISDVSFMAVETPKNGSLYLATGVGQNPLDLAGRMIPVEDAPLYDAVTASGIPLVLDDMSADERAARSPALAGQRVGPVLAVPLADPAGTEGVLIVARPPGAEPFSHGDIELAQGFGAHATLALRFSRVYEEGRGRMRSDETTRAFGTQMTADQSFRVAAQGILRVADADVVARLVLERDSVFVASAVGAGAEDLFGRAVDRQHAPMLSEVVAGGAAVVLGDAAADERGAWSATLADVPLGPLIAVPLTEPPSVLIIARAPGRDQFSSGEVELAGSFAAHAGLVLRANRRYDDARKSRAWSDVMIRAGSTLLADPTGEGLRAVAQALRPVADAVFVEIDVRDGDTVTVATSVGADPSPPAGRTLSISEAPLLDHVTVHNAPVTIDDGSADERITRSASLAGIRIGPVLAVPLVGSTAPYGALIIGRAPGAKAFTPAEVELAEGFAVHTALALQSIQPAAGRPADPRSVDPRSVDPHSPAERPDR